MMVDMEDVKSVSRKKIAGIPVLYLAFAVAAVILFLAMRVKPATDTAATDAESTDTTDGGDSLSGDMGEPVVTNPVFVANPTTQTVAENTNDLWARQAIQWLISSGATVSEATNAIQKYLSGDTLSYREGELRDKAVTEFGLPPEDIVSGKTLGYKGPASKQGEPPTTHTVKGTSDNSYEELARLYYGLSGSDPINFLRSRNASLVEPFAVGTRVTIPVWKNPRYYRATSATRTLYAIARVESTTPSAIQALNPGMEFPVRPGTRVRTR